MTSKKDIPPFDGSRTAIPGFLDFHVEYHPSLPMYGFLSREDPSKITYISYLEFAQASHRVAHIVRPGAQGPLGEVIAILATCDVLVYQAMMTGMARSGVISFPMSPRNSPEAVFSMLQKVDCHRIISQPSMADAMNDLLAICKEKGYALKVDSLPPLKDMFPTLGQPSDTQPYPPQPTKPDGIVTYLHSSGSTGFPKPIALKQYILLEWAQSEAIEFLYKDHDRTFTGLLPAFHMLGFFSQLIGAVLSNQPIMLFTPQDPEPAIIPNPQNAIEAAQATGCTAVIAVPSFIEVWADSDDTVEYLKGISDLRFSGGPLSAKNSKKLLEAGVRITSVYGSTECGGTTLSADPKWGWGWLKFSKNTKPRWIPQGDGTYELQFLTCDTHHMAVENLPDVSGYTTSDLFEPHPTEPGLWRIVGRSDDVIVLGSGEKIVPAPQEGHIVTCPYVSGAVMFGREKTQPGLLVEPSPGNEVPAGDTTALVEFRDKIWPWVEEANKTSPSFARIFKEMILVTDPAKPLPRAGKGTVQRKQAITIYTQEVEDMYETVKQSSDSNGIPLPDSWAVEDVEEWLLKHAKSIMIGDHKRFSPSKDVFQQGFDSLSATYLRNRIIGALRSSNHTAAEAAAVKVPQDLIFSHPTLQRLASAVADLVHTDLLNGIQYEEDEDFIEEMVAKYSMHLPTFKRAGSGAEREIVVLLTGSTGNLGTHILASLLADKRVVKVFTLNRSSPRHDRQRTAFAEAGHPLELLDSKALHPLIGDIASPDLGLNAPTVAELKNSVTHVIHNAWKLDFNLSLSSYEYLVALSRNLIHLCSECENPVRFIFTSSIAAAQNWDSKKGPVPEQVLTNADVAVGTGYGAAKYVVERILHNASQKGLSSTTFRIGQICGSPPAGVWNTTDWVPIIVKSSIVLGCLPASEVSSPWITMDTTAHTITDVVLSVTKKPAPPLVNVVHPRPVPWNFILQSISNSLTRPLPLVPLPEWLDKVEKASVDSSTANLNAIPAIKLLKFLRKITVAEFHQAFETSRCQSVSPTLKQAGRIDLKTVQSWVKYWMQKGFIA